MFIVSDTAVNIDPTAKQLADIAIASAKTATALAGLDPRVAMLSYSTHGSGTGKSVDKVKEATERVRKLDPELIVEGELQADAALRPKVARVKSVNNEWKGKANVLVFPDLNSGNIAYKLMQMAGKIKAIGPIMQGFDKPVNDLSRGSSLKEIVLTVALTVIQASKYDELERLELLEEERKDLEARKIELAEQKEQNKKERRENFKNKLKAPFTKKSKVTEDEDEIIEEVKEVKEVDEKKVKEEIKSMNK